MILDVRTYTLVLRRQGLELRATCGWDPLNQVVPSVALREPRRGGVQARQRVTPTSTGASSCLSQDDKVVRPIPFSPAQGPSAGKGAILPHQEQRALKHRGERPQVALIGDDEATELTDDEAAAQSSQRLGCDGRLAACHCRRLDAHVLARFHDKAHLPVHAVEVVLAVRDEQEHDLRTIEGGEPLGGPQQGGKA